MAKATTVRLTPKAEEALASLRSQAGGFVLQSAVSRWIIEECERRDIDEADGIGEWGGMEHELEQAEKRRGKQ